MLKLRVKILVIFIAINCVHCKGLSGKNETKPIKATSNATKSLDTKTLVKSKTDKRESANEMGMYGSNYKEEPFRPIFPMQYTRELNIKPSQHYQTLASAPQVSYMKSPEGMQYAAALPKPSGGVQYASSAYRGPFIVNYDSYQPANYGPIAPSKAQLYSAPNSPVPQQYTYEQLPQKQPIHYVIAIPEEYMRHLQESLATPSRTPHAFAIPANVVRIFPLNSRENIVPKHQIGPIYYNSGYQSMQQYPSETPISMAMHYAPTVMNALYNGIAGGAVAAASGGGVGGQQFLYHPQPRFQYQQSFQPNPFYPIHQQQQQHQQQPTSFYVYPSQQNQHPQPQHQQQQQQQLLPPVQIASVPKQLAVGPSPVLTFAPATSSSSSPATIVHFKPVAKTFHSQQIPPSSVEHSNQLYQSSGASYIPRLLQSVPAAGQSVMEDHGPTSSPARLTAQSTIFAQPIYPTIASNTYQQHSRSTVQSLHQGPTEKVPSAQQSHHLHLLPAAYHKQSQPIPLYSLPSNIQYGTHLIQRHHQPLMGKVLQVLPHRHPSSSPSSLYVSSPSPSPPHPSSIPAAASSNHGGGGGVVVSGGSSRSTVVKYP